MSRFAGISGESWRKTFFSRRILPSASGWVGLLASPSSYLMVAALLATAVAKIRLALALEGTESELYLLGWAWLLDVTVYLGLATAMAFAESRWRWASWITTPFAVVVALFAAANVTYLIIAGDQATWGGFVQLFRRINDAFAVIREGFTPPVAATTLLALLAGAAIPWWVRRSLCRRACHRERATARARSSAWLAVGAGIAALALPTPGTRSAQALGRNGLVSLFTTIGSPVRAGEFRGYSPLPGKVDAETTSAPIDQRHNIIVLVLESTRYDFTSLATEPHRHAAETPHLARLATKGLNAPTARAVVPHTTKALFSILCGRLPLLQKELIELTTEVEVDCLPSMLGRLGYHTAFFQSAFGTFEERPRLAGMFGFDTFKAWEDIKGERLGYLASDDESLSTPFRTWLDGISRSGNPFFAMFLTSGPHHPYRLTQRSETRAKEQNKPTSEPTERYARLLESGDALLGDLLDVLQFRSLDEKTIVIILGDHGEGFGDHGVRQHDNNFYEEGIRVPLVFAGPGVPKGTVDGNASLVDVFPTVLDLVDYPADMRRSEGVVGLSLLSQAVPASEPRWFSCWFSERCRGFVVGHRKVVEDPDSREIWYFDLAKDPLENNPKPLTKDLEALLPAYREVFARHTTDPNQDFRRRYYDRFDPWICPEHRTRCLHPESTNPNWRPQAGAERKPPEGDSD